MAALTDIRRGIAAELRTVLPASSGQVYPWLLDNPTPPSLVVAGLAPDGLEGTGMGAGQSRYLIVVEACLDLGSDIGSQAMLDSWITDVPATLEAANAVTGALTKRMSDDGAVTTGQPAACDSISLDRYRGQQPFTLPNGTRVLLAGWTFEVLT